MKMTENLTVLHKLLHSTKGCLSLKDLTFCKMKGENKGKLMMDGSVPMYTSSMISLALFFK